MNKKYLEIFRKSLTKKDFIKVAMDTFPIKKSSAERRWYECKSVEPKKILAEEKVLIKNTFRGQLSQPDTFKMLTVQDMVSKGYKPNRKFLRRYGFSESEINWLIDKSYINEP